MVSSIATLFFFNDTATTEIYTLSLHDALPISPFTSPPIYSLRSNNGFANTNASNRCSNTFPNRSEEHTSELQSQTNVVCRLLLDNNQLVFDRKPHGVNCSFAAFYSEAKHRSWL